MKLLNQLDPKWKDNYLGFSNNTTIGSHGCLITCLAMLADLTPDDVNERLKNVNGFINQNLVIWAKITEAINWLKLEWRHYIFDKEEVEAAIKDFGGCIVEVDGKKIGGDRHWVVYINNNKMNDPWQGVIREQSYYPALGFVVIQTKPQEDPLAACMKDRQQFWEERDEARRVIGTQAETLLKKDDEIKILSDQTKTLTEKLEQLEELRAKWYKLYSQANESYKICQTDRESLARKCTLLLKVPEIKNSILNRIFYLNRIINKKIEEIDKLITRR